MRHFTNHRKTGFDLGAWLSNFCLRHRQNDLEPWERNWEVVRQRL